MRVFSVISRVPTQPELKKFYFKPNQNKGKSFTRPLSSLAFPTINFIIIITL